MTFDETMHMIAQGAINITEQSGNEFKPDCPIHKAMNRLCDLVTAGRVGILPLTVSDWQKGLRLAQVVVAERPPGAHVSDEKRDQWLDRHE